MQVVFSGQHATPVDDGRGIGGEECLFEAVAKAGHVLDAGRLIASEELQRCVHPGGERDRLGAGAEALLLKTAEELRIEVENCHGRSVR